MHEVGYIRISRKKLYPLTEILFVVKNEHDKSLVNKIVIQ